MSAENTTLEFDIEIHGDWRVMAEKIGRSFDGFGKSLEPALVQDHTIQGAKQLADNYLGDVSRAQKRILYDIANQIMEDAKRHTPVKTGALRRSGRVQAPTQSGDVVKTELTFGNSDEVDYAIPVHEITTSYHHVGQAKYLEQAIQNSRFEQKLSDAMKRELS